MQTIDLSGLWTCAIPEQQAAIRIPGTLDESGIGGPDTGANSWHPDAEGNKALAGLGVITTRLTRCHTYEGPATIERTIDWEVPAGRVFLEVERARVLTLRVNGQEVRHFVPQTISTPHVFEVTGLVTGHDTLTIVSDNSYPGLPRDAIVYSSAATDESQTNWNGLLGYVRLRLERETFIHSLRAYPHGELLDVAVSLSSDAPWQGTVTLQSAALAQPVIADVSMEAGMREVWLRDLPLRADVRRWDEDEGVLYLLRASGEGLDAVDVTFGVREVGVKDGRLTLNGRVVFLRSEANCCIFPETGHAPMTVDEWTRVLRTYRAYGVNQMRFHSHIPPEAAFEAADRLGMLMQPELSHWNPRTAFEDDESFAYYAEELHKTLLTLANHPSFVMLTLGNEVACGELGHQRMDALLALAKTTDFTRLYANGSNVAYGSEGCDPASDFYTAAKFLTGKIRGAGAGMSGYINETYPSAAHNYDPVMADLRKTYDRPVISFEVGQFEVLPDFDELDDFQGVTRANNLALIRDRVAELGFADEWKRRVAATGELSRLCYREEVEAALRTPELSGISLLGLQDFTGQGTALVGMMNSHLRPKPFAFAQPERFSSFFASCVPLALLPKYTYENTETLTVPVRFANYGRSDVRGSLMWELSGEGVGASGMLPPMTAPQGELTDLGVIRVELSGVAQATRLDLHVWFAGTENSYPLWVYPPVTPVCPANVYETRVLDEAALAVLAQGGAVLLAPDATADAIPNSIKTQFSTDFWSVGTFGSQSGAMGQLIDVSHPIFSDFPTDFHTNWQWWPMAGQRAAILPRNVPAVVTALDCYAYLRPMAQLLECRCNGGRLMLSTMGLHALQQYPEARALLAAVYAYLGRGEFADAPEVEVEFFRGIGLND